MPRRGWIALLMNPREIVMDENLEAPVPKNHSVRRAAWIEIVLIYGFFISLAIWNWW